MDTNQLADVLYTNFVNEVIWEKVRNNSVPGGTIILDEKREDKIIERITSLVESIDKEKRRSKYNSAMVDVQGKLHEFFTKWRIEMINKLEENGTL